MVITEVGDLALDFGFSPYLPRLAFTQQYYLFVTPSVLRWDGSPRLI